MMRFHGNASWSSHGLGGPSSLENKVGRDQVGDADHGDGVGVAQIDDAVAADNADLKRDNENLRRVNAKYRSTLDVMGRLISPENFDA